MKPLGSRSGLLHFLVGFLLFPLARSVEAAPLVSSISPDAARPGEVLEVTGTGFKGTQDVLFVSGTAVKPAKFKVKSDERLVVTFPEYYRGAGTASIIVVGIDGVTVAMSDDMQTIDSVNRTSTPFVHVVKNGLVNDAREVIAVVDDGGGIAICNSTPVCFVKHRGMLGDFTGSIIFFEPGAMFGPKLRERRPPPKLIRVRDITISPHVDPLLIKTPEAPRPFAKEPPGLISVTPSVGIPGDVVVLKGVNLSHVSNVYFVDPNRGLEEAGFKATSDETVRVEIPQHVFGTPLIVVRNPVGIAVNIGELPAPTDERSGVLAAERERMYGPTFQVEYVGPGHVDDTGGGQRLCIVDNGGALKSGAGNCCFLVRNGGLLGQPGGGNCVVFHETYAKLPFLAGLQRPPPGLNIIDVGQMIFCPRPFILDVGDIDRRF